MLFSNYTVVALASTPIMTIVPSITQTYVSPNGITSVTFTVTNNTHKVINKITIDTAYATTGLAANIKLQNNQCISLAPGASCHFGVLISGKNQPLNFKISPRVCAYDGAVCSQPLCNNDLIVHIPTQKPIAYVGLIFGTNINNLFPIDTNTLKLGTPLPGFNFDVEQPDGVSVSNDGTRIYVTSQDDSTLHIVSGGLTPSNLATINLGGDAFPVGVVISPDDSKVYVANTGNNTIDVISTATNQIIKTIVLGSIGSPIEPYGITISPDGLTVYVANLAANTVAVINTLTNTVTATIPVGANPFEVAVSPDGSKVYTSNSGSSSISVINASTNTVSATIALGAGTTPKGIVVSHDGNTLYVADFTGFVDVINTSTLVLTSTIAIGGLPVGVALTPDGTGLFVSNQNFAGQFVTKINIPAYTLNNIDATGAQFTIGNFVG